MNQVPLALNFEVSFWHKVPCAGISWSSRMQCNSRLDVYWPWLPHEAVLHGNVLVIGVGMSCRSNPGTI